MDRDTTQPIDALALPSPPEESHLPGGENFTQTEGIHRRKFGGVFRPLSLEDQWQWQWVGCFFLSIIHFLGILFGMF